MKIVQFGLCFSPNLGDGVIAECIGHGLRTKRPDATVTHIDLSGRQDFGQVVIPNREAILAIVDRLPLFIRQRLAQWKLNRLVDGVADQWRKAAQANLAIIGGGQVFSDSNLNFPIKIGRVADILAQTQTPTAVFGVGVSKNWTPKGKHLFHKLADADVRMVGVRDDGSAAGWRAQMSQGPAPELTLDPGLLAALHYGPVADPKGVGLCVTDFGILAHHASGTVAGAAATATAFYAGIAGAVLKKGHAVTLFCNGAAEDIALLEKVAADPSLQGYRDANHLHVPTAPRTPTELVAIIAGCEAVIAHRLHACIVAYSYGRPIVGLGWDTKLDAFFETAGLSGCFSSAPDLSAQDVADLVTGAMAQGIDADHHAKLLADTWDGFDRVLACAATAPAAP